MSEGKKIVLGITGSIAAYKSCLIIRELIKRGAQVLVGFALETNDEEINARRKLEKKSRLHRAQFHSKRRHDFLQRLQQSQHNIIGRCD